MRWSAVNDCVDLLGHFGIDPHVRPAIDIGGTETVYIDGEFRANPLLDVSPGLTLLDRGFNIEAASTTADEVVDFLDPEVAARLADKYEAVYCFDTLEHASNPFRFAEHLVRIAKPGGFVYAATIFEWPYHPSPEDYFRFSPTGLAELFVGPANALRTEVEIVWHGWGSDRRAVALLARRTSGPPTGDPSPPTTIDDLLGREPPRASLAHRAAGRVYHGLARRLR